MVTILIENSHWNNWAELNESKVNGSVQKEAEHNSKAQNMVLQ